MVEIFLGDHTAIKQTIAKTLEMPIPMRPVELLPSKLFSILKAIRLELSIKYKVPPFMIFHNKTLIEMTKSLPTDINSLLRIKGIGKYKAETYGKKFIFRLSQNNSYVYGISFAY